MNIEDSVFNLSDNIVLKTVNFRESATRKDTKGTFVLAYKNYLKGITVYRKQFQKVLAYEP